MLISRPFEGWRTEFNAGRASLPLSCTRRSFQSIIKHFHGFEFAIQSGNIELQMEEILIRRGSRLTGLTLEECGIGRDLGVIIGAVKQSSGDTRFNPTFRGTIKSGDTLTALGETAELKMIEKMAVKGEN
jgi:K+/H+ antiporter YhaU regulatory subunit KhtT